MKMTVITFLAAMAVIITGMLLKRYTNGKLNDIDGFSQIIIQDTKDKHIIDQF